MIFYRKQRGYSLVHNSTAAFIKLYQTKYFILFRTISYILAMNNFGFDSFPDLKLLFKILILVFSNLNLKLQKFNIAVTYLCQPNTGLTQGDQIGQFLTN